MWGNPAGHGVQIFPTTTTRRRLNLSANESLGAMSWADSPRFKWSSSSSGKVATFARSMLSDIRTVTGAAH
jgi:hypothetical protein